ncbi:MAG TPA: MFS transporter [Acidimicrobiia bacterium]|nr:MFS transporter [Acidimicrobiia bacterium]
MSENPLATDSALPARSVPAMVVVASALVLGALPLFMVGGLAVQIKDEFGLTEAALGAGVTIGFLTGALSAPLGGRFADRIGPKASTYLGASLSIVSLIGLGVIANGWGSMVTFLCVAGLAVAITDPGLAILVGQAVPPERQGLAFGIKEASIPAATLVAGLAVPAIALTVGWRWGFVAGALPLAAVLLLLPGLRTEPTDHPKAEPTAAQVSTTPRRGRLVLAAIAGGIGVAAASGVGIFLTDSAVAMGMSPGGAGILLAVGSVAGIAARIGAGARADRTGGPQFKLIAAMLAVGAVTMALGGTGNAALLVVGTIGAFTGGWAWTGIYFLSLVMTYPHRPGAVTGIAVAGLGLGNATGPLLFGVAAQTLSFEAAWLGAAMVAGAASILMARAAAQF